jgi:hypothetical protein
VTSYVPIQNGEIFTLCLRAFVSFAVRFGIRAAHHKFAAGNRRHRIGDLRAGNGDWCKPSCPPADFSFEASSPGCDRGWPAPWNHRDHPTSPARRRRRGQICLLSEYGPDSALPPGPGIRDENNTTASGRRCRSSARVRRARQRLHQHRRPARRRKSSNCAGSFVPKIAINRLLPLVVGNEELPRRLPAGRSFAAPPRFEFPARFRQRADRESGLARS